MCRNRPRARVCLHILNHWLDTFNKGQFKRKLRLPPTPGILHGSIKRPNRADQRLATKRLGLIMQEYAPLFCGIHQIISGHFDQQHLPQMLDHLLPKLARVGPAVNRGINYIQPPGRIIFEQRLRQRRLEAITVSGLGS